MTPSLQFLIHDTDTFCPTQAADPWLFASVRIRDPRTGHDLTLCFGEASTAARLADALARLAVEWLAQSAPVDPDWKTHDHEGLKPPSAIPVGSVVAERDDHPTASATAGAKQDEYEAALNEQFSAGEISAAALSDAMFDAAHDAKEAEQEDDWTRLA